MPDAWQLWSQDFFDRDAAPFLERSGTGRRDGLLLLWQRTLDEGVDDRGRPTFTWFTLSLAGGPRLTVPRDPLDNPELARLRAARNQPWLLPLLARAVDERPFDEAVRVLFDALREAESAAALRALFP